MEICNSYYLVPNDKEQAACTGWLKAFFSSEIVMDEEKTKNQEDLVVNLPITGKWVEFSIEYKKQTYNAFYKTYYGNTKNRKNVGFYLEIKIDYQKDKRKHADAFSYEIQQLKKSKKDDFYLVVMDDELSRYFAEISYKYLAIYERKLRQLLLVITVPIDGKNWSENLKDNNSDLNSTEKNKIERGLEELDLSDFETLLFNPVVNFDKHNYDNKFNIKNLDKLSKDDIIEIIKENKPESFWDRYIQKYIQINDDVPDKMKNIRKQRNKIAHNKYFSSEDQKEFVKDVKYISGKIDAAIAEILSHKEKFNIDLGVFKQYVEMTERITKQYSEMLSKLDVTPLIKAVTDVLKFSNPFLSDKDDSES